MYIRNAGDIVNPSFISKDMATYFFRCFWEEKVFMQNVVGTVVTSHNVIIGVYPLLPNGTCRFSVFEITGIRNEYHVVKRDSYANSCTIAFVIWEKEDDIG